MKHIYVLFFLTLIFGCSTSEVITQNHKIDVRKHVAIDSLFSSYEYIILETNQEAIISDISKLIVSDDKILICSDNKIFVFNKDGKYLSNVSRRGRDAREYIAIDDFDFADGMIYILNRAQKKINSYETDGKFVKSIKLDNWFNHLRILNSNEILLSSENANDSNNDFVTVDIETGETVRRYGYFPRNQNYIFAAFTPFCGKKDNYILATTPFSNTLYKITENEATPYLDFSFNTDEQLPTDISEYSFKELASKYRYADVVKNIGLYAEIGTKKYLTFELFGQKGGLASYVCMIDSSGHSVSCQLGESFSMKYPYIGRPYCIDGDELVSARSAGEVLYIEKYYQLSKFNKMGITAESNPIIFLYKLRH